ncbi:MAG: hypothetical protein AAF802_15215 [Planctomycetota bacterium]
MASLPNGTETLEDQLERVAQTGEWTEIKLPSGSNVVVAPGDGLDSLQKVLRDPDFFAALRNAVVDVEEGRVEAHDDDLFKPGV